MNFLTMPKAELHLHLEGAAPPAFIRQLAGEKSINLDGLFNEDGSYAFRDFDHFLKVYEQATQVLTSPEDFGRLVTAVLEKSAKQGVIYSETFVSPDFCGGGDLGAWREYLHAMQEAATRMEASHGIVLRGIVTCIRHFGPETAKTAALCAAETAGDWIVGFGMAGSETVGTPGDYAYSFDMAREAGLHLTVHAGEWRGASDITATLDALRPARIGHGVRAIEDPHLVDRLAREKIVLEVCPVSNVHLGVFPTMAAHPIARLRDAGVPVTVSTDDPPFFHTDLETEYKALAKVFDWDADVFHGLNETALQAAFCDDATKERLMKRLSTDGPA